MGWVRQGIEYKNSKLYIFNKKEIIVLKGYPKPAAWRRTKTRPFKCIRYKGTLFSAPEKEEFLKTDTRLTETHLRNLYDTYYSGRCYPELMLKQDINLNRFMSNVPDVIWCKLIRHEERQWHLFCLLSRCEKALELYESNPALVFCLASSWAFNKKSPSHHIRNVKNILHKKQRQICSWLGFSGTKNTVRILQKINPADIYIRDMFVLRWRLQSPESLKILSHLSGIQRVHFDLMRDPAWFNKFTFSFLEFFNLHPESYKASQNSGQPDIESLLISINDLCLTLHFHYCYPVENLGVFPISSITELEHVCSRLKKTIAELNKKDKGKINFPAPPVKGVKNIFPISDIHKLTEEANRQNNCALQHVYRIASGRSYLYSMLKPERVTIEIVNNGSSWQLGEFRTNNNRKVTPATARAVKKWFDEKISGLKTIPCCSSVFPGQLCNERRKL